MCAVALSATLKKNTNAWTGPVYPISPIPLIHLALGHSQIMHTCSVIHKPYNTPSPPWKSQPAVTKCRLFINTVYWLILPSKTETINQGWRVWDSLWVKDWISCLKRTNLLLPGVIGNKGWWCITREEETLSVAFVDCCVNDRSGRSKHLFSFAQPAGEE